MKKLGVLVFIFLVQSAFGMHRVFTGDQVKGVLAHCDGLRRLVPLFNVDFVHNTTAQNMQDLTADLNAGVAYCRMVGAQLDADGWPKAVRDVAAYRRTLECAVRMLHDCIAYAHDPAHVPYPIQPVHRRPVLQFDEE